MDGYIKLAKPFVQNMEGGNDRNTIISIMGKYENLAKIILDKVGGKSNISSLTHCVTRLRFRLKDESLADDEGLKNTDGVVTVMHSAGQYQVVIGNHVPLVYKDFLSVAEMRDDDTIQEDNSPKGFFNKFMDIISGSFQPLLGVMCAMGIVKGLNAFIGFVVGAGYSVTGTYQVLNAIGDALFYFLPVILGFTSAKKFKLNPMIGMAIGAVLVYPSIQLSAISATGAAIGNAGILGEYHTTFLGIPFIAGNYTQTVVPVIAIVYLASKLEKLFKKVIPEMIQAFFVPLFVMLVSLPVGLLVIGPVISMLTNLLSQIFEQLNLFSPLLFGAVIGFAWMFLVIFGLHWALVPMMILNISQLGFDTIVVALYGHSFALLGAILAMYLKYTDKNKKALAIPAMISSFCGVTEPGIYGFALPEKLPFLFSCIASGIAGAIFTILAGKSYIMGGLGIFGILNFIAPDGNIRGVYLGLICIVVSIVIAFVLTLLFWKNSDINNNSTNNTDNLNNSNKDDKISVKKEVVSSPVKGKVIALENLDDAAFAQGVLGKGVGVELTDGKVYAPFDGTVTTLFPTNHAIGITSDLGTDLLIHVGIDTVNLNGEGFLPHIKQGDKVKRGQLILEVDLNILKEKGINVQTPVIVTNTDDYVDIIDTKQKEVNNEDMLLTLIF